MATTFKQESLDYSLVQTVKFYERSMTFCIHIIRQEGLSVEDQPPASRSEQVWTCLRGRVAPDGPQVNKVEHLLDGVVPMWVGRDWSQSDQVWTGLKWRLDPPHPLKVLIGRLIGKHYLPAASLAGGNEHRDKSYGKSNNILSEEYEFFLCLFHEMFLDLFKFCEYCDVDLQKCDSYI